jgi:hypothetical protein
MGRALSNELGVMYVDVPDFYKVFCNRIPELATASDTMALLCLIWRRFFI